MKRPGRITISQVAEKANVAVTTASLVLNPRETPVPISEKTKRRVMQAAEELSYIPNHLASALRQGKTMSIGLILPTHDAEMMDTIEITARRAGYSLLVKFTPNPDEKQEHFAIRDLLARQVDGLIWMPWRNTEHPGILGLLSQIGPRLVTVEKRVDRLPRAHWVDFDYDGAMRRAGELARREGYARMGYVYPADDHERLTPRRRALAAGAAAAGVAAVELPTERADDGTFDYTRFGDCRAEPLLVVCDFDWLAHRVVWGLKATPWRIPDDLGVVVMGDMLLWSRYRLGDILSPRLTALQRQFGVVAEWAVGCLTDVFAHPNEDAYEARREIVPMPLVERESTQRTRQ